MLFKKTLKRLFNNKSHFLAFTGLFLIQSTQAASVNLANQPLLDTPTATVQPNILFVMDDSGSMDWSFLPDKVKDIVGDYGYQSSQCNRIYYNPTVTYSAPAIGTEPVGGNYARYPDSSFTSAKDNGFETSSPTRNLNSEFIANRFWPEASNDYFSGRGSYKGGTSLGPYGAVYYRYTGTETDRDYEDTSSTFYTECSANIQNYLTVGRTRQLKNSTLFQKRRLSTNMTTTINVVDTGGTAIVSSVMVNGYNILNSATSGSDTASIVASRIANGINAKSDAYSATVSGTTVTVTGPSSAANYWPEVNSNNMHFEVDIFPETAAAELTNFANWYTYYRTRFQAMKTSAGQAFSVLGADHRVGYMQLNESRPTHEVATFTGAERQDWYDDLYAADDNGGTPLRVSLSKAGRYYANKLSGASDPMQYSCQQNFTLLSTDGYWNGGTGKQLNGTTDVGDQDGEGQADRPQFDGGKTSGETVTYRRYRYRKTRSGCWWGRSRLNTREQRATCEVATAGDSCTPGTWRDYTSSNSGSCQRNNRWSLPNPNPTGSVEIARVASSRSVGGQANTLADVAQYYYKTDLRDSALSNCTGTTRLDGTTGDVCTNDVVTTTRDDNNQQHMNTFTLGLGINGLMKFVPNYENVAGDYQDILTADVKSATKCQWETNDGDTCNWPRGMADEQPENIDDLWHAAVNGRGTYFSAEEPSTLAKGIADALFGISKIRGAASAASSSTLQPVQGDNDSFLASYTTQEWTGNLESRPIDTDTGVASLSATWCLETIKATQCATPLTSETVNNSKVFYCETPESNSCKDGGGFNAESSDPTNSATVCKTQVTSACTGTFTTQRKDPTLTNPMVSASSDNRTIYTSTFDAGIGADGAYGLTPFNSAFQAANPSYFDATKLASLSQWDGLTASQKTSAVQHILGYLRGHFAYDNNPDNEILNADSTITDNRLFRERNAILGDILESQPLFLGKSTFGYNFPGYEAYKLTRNSDADVSEGTIFVGANDGMLHAINASDGSERWAFIPSMILPELWRLADIDYGNDGMHRNFINGSPTASDVCISSCDTASAVWKTIMVVGLNAGGRGYFALDVTDPTSPDLLWEFGTSTNIGRAENKDDNLGYSFAKPLIVRKSDGSWVVLVTSGYNNILPGDGKGYLFELDIATGKKLKVYTTNVGDTTTPSGLGKISAWNNSPGSIEVNYLFGGDLAGNLWRFNLDAADGSTAFKLAELGSTQPITTKPLLDEVEGNRVVVVGTGKLLEGSDITASISTQTIYAIKDDFADNATAGYTNLRADTLMKEQTIVNSVSSDGETIRELDTTEAVNWGTDKGWYVDLPDAGERINVDPVIVLGKVFFPSTVPTSTSCKPNGYGWLNFFDVATAGPVEGFVGKRFSNPLAGIGVLFLGDQAVVNYVTTRGETGVAVGGISSSADEFTGTRTIWRELLE